MKWKKVLALTVAGVLIAGPAWAQAQSGSGAGTTPGKSGTTDKSPGGAAGTSDKSGAGSATSGGASTGTTSGTAGSAGTTDKSAGGDMKADKASRSAAGGNKEQVKAVQQALKDKGHDPGEVDGVMGQKTQSALRDFQKKEGLKETGRLDSESASKLGVSMKTGAADGSSPSASPSTGQDGSKSGASAGASSGSSSPGASSGGAASASGAPAKKSK
jgi:peptidoglycan hydrolase-like protein with peptidoglycan-binding domain